MHDEIAREREAGAGIRQQNGMLESLLDYQEQLQEALRSAAEVGAAWRGLAPRRRV